jgi:hypothetical protein
LSFGNSFDAILQRLPTELERTKLPIAELAPDELFDVGLVLPQLPRVIEWFRHGLSTGVLLTPHPRPLSNKGRGEKCEAARRPNGRTPRKVRLSSVRCCEICLWG